MSPIVGGTNQIDSIGLFVMWPLQSAETLQQPFSMVQAKIQQSIQQLPHELLNGQTIMNSLVRTPSHREGFANAHQRQQFGFNSQGLANSTNDPWIETAGKIRTRQRQQL